MLNRSLAPVITLNFDLRALGANKELALVFRFDALLNARLLIFSDAGQLGDVALIAGDDQFLMELEELGPTDLYFIHSRKDGSNVGGDWFFKGITGWVV